jgi:hypothetical protein
MEPRHPPDPVPDRPEGLRAKAREYRAAAETEANPERRRAYMFIASEYDQLADALENEGAEDADAGGRIPKRNG